MEEVQASDLLPAGAHSGSWRTFLRSRVAGYDVWRPFLILVGLIALSAVEGAAWGNSVAGPWLGGLVLFFDHRMTLLLLPLIGLRSARIRIPALVVVLGWSLLVTLSHEFCRLRGGAMAPDELAFAIGRTDNLHFLLSMAMHWQYLIGLILAALVVGPLPSWCRRIGHPGPVAILGIGLVGLLIAAQGVLVAVHGADPRWRSVFLRPPIGFVAYIKQVFAGTWRLDRSALAQVRKIERAEVLTRPPDPVLAHLAGAYRDRDAVVILLESHRAPNIEWFAQDFPGYERGSPELSRWSDQGVAFSRMFALNQKTSCALWSMLACLSEPGACAPPLNDPVVADFSPWAAFKAAGYRLLFHQGCDLDFENTRGVLEGLFDDLARTRADQTRVDDASRGRWGMDDSVLFDQALVRMQECRRAGTRFVLVLQTLAAHLPYDHPWCDQPTTDRHAQAMRYTDHHLGSFLERWQALSEAERPLLFITADHSYAFGLDGSDLDAQRRVPGLLVTPDLAYGGAVVDQPFGITDVGGLLAGLLGIPWELPTPCERSRRGVLGKLANAPHLVVAPPLAVILTRPVSVAPLLRGASASPPDDTIWMERWSTAVDGLWSDRPRP